MSALPGMRERTVLMGGFSQGLRDDRLADRLRLRPLGDPRGDRQGPPVRDHVGPHDGPGRGTRGAHERRAGRRARCAAEYDRRRRLLVDGLNAMGLATFEPRGAFYAFPRITSTGLDDDAFVERLLREEHVAAVPGSAFGPSGAGPRPHAATRRATRSSRRPWRGSAGSWPQRKRGASRPREPLSGALERYEAVIGVEVHCQVRTASKMFCACAVPTGRRGPEHATPARSAWRCPASCPRSTARPSSTSRHRPGDRGATRPGAPAGIARTTSTRISPRATRSASTTCRWRRTGRSPSTRRRGR